MATLTAQELLMNALRARQEGRAAEALRQFAAVIAAEPDQPVARNVLGMDALERGDAATAAEHFGHAVRGDPHAPPLWINLATARRLQGDNEGERAALEGALSVDRTHLMALIRLAQLHERLGETTQAGERWGDVTAASVHVPNPPPDLAEVFAHARQIVAQGRQRLVQELESALGDELEGASECDRRRASAAADLLVGKRRVFVNECHGFHYPFLPTDEYFDRSHFPWFEELEAATPMIRAELEAIMADADPGLRPYIEMPSGTPENIWTRLDGSLDWGSLHLWKDGERIDGACERAPKTAALIDRMPLCKIPNRAPHVFFSILKAGKTIPPHTGVTNVRAIIHLPLIVPGDCAFRVGGETREWREGEAFAFDDTIEHEAWNRSNKDRAVLILDTWNPHLSEHEQQMICRMFGAMAAAKG
jgi:aspartyl/asparaginyl beta-hydroxylase (cupin superfamily)